MPNGHFETLMQDAPQDSRMSPQPSQPNTHISHQHGIQELAMPSSSLRRGSFADTEIDVHGFEAAQGGQSCAPIPACPGTERRRTSRDSFSDVEPSPPCTPEDSFLSTASSTEHENKEPGETGVVQPKGALVPPPSPEAPAAELNLNCTSGQAQDPVDLPNVSASSGPICRICHEGEEQAALLSMCKCTGSLGLVHVPCLERWLNARNADDCELCHHRFPTTITPQNSSLVRFFHWFLQCETQTRWAVLEDLLIFTLTPLFPAVMCYISVQDASMESIRSHTWLGPFLMTTFAVAYTAALVLTARSHYLSFLSWQSKNQIRTLLVAPPPSGTGASHNTASEQATSTV